MKIYFQKCCCDNELCIQGIFYLASALTQINLKGKKEGTELKPFIWKTESNENVNFLTFPTTVLYLTQT